MKFPHRNLSIPDVHLGHPRTDAEDILVKLLDELTIEKLNKVDILYFPGDLFDMAIMMSSKTSYWIILYLSELLRRCHVTNTAVRLLRGTPLHDARQGHHLQAIAQANYPDLDFRYVDDMEIEYIEKFDIHVMYVPDEWDTREKMYERAVELLLEHQLTQVDFIIGHNQFYFQYPAHLHGKVSALREQDWNEMVRYTAYFGHIHKRSNYGKIEFAGSFDRLVHGEEEPKGYLEGIYRSPSDTEIVFHENKRAQVYKTIPIDSTAEDFQFNDFYHQILSDLEQLPEHSHVRFSLKDKIAIKELVDKLKLHRPDITFTWIRQDEKTSERHKELSIDNKATYLPIAITEENIVELFTELSKDSPNAPQMISLLEQCLSSMK